MSNRSCDNTVVPPMDNKVVIVEGHVVSGGWFGGDVGGWGSVGEDV